MFLHRRKRPWNLTQKKLTHKVYKFSILYATDRRTTTQCDFATDHIAIVSSNRHRM